MDLSNLLNEIVGFNIKRFRTILGISRTSLAEDLEVDRSTVAQWELGNRYPRSEQIMKMAELFSVHPTKFFVDPSDISLSKELDQQSLEYIADLVIKKQKKQQRTRSRKVKKK